MALLIADDPRLDLQRKSFTVSEVERMLEAGILHDGEPVELLEGELFLTSPQRPEHAAITEIVGRLLEGAMGGGFHARRHSPLLAGPDSLPEPDIAIARGEPRDFLHQHPTGADVVLVIEIALTSHALDRRKAAIYARAGVPEYWLLDLAGRTLDVRTNPGPEAADYAEQQVLREGDTVTLPHGGEIPVAALLPPGPAR